MHVIRKIRSWLWGPPKGLLQVCEFSSICEPHSGSKGGVSSITDVGWNVERALGTWDCREVGHVSLCMWLLSWALKDEEEYYQVLEAGWEAGSNPGFWTRKQHTGEPGMLLWFGGCKGEERLFSTTTTVPNSPGRGIL